MKYADKAWVVGGGGGSEVTAMTLVKGEPMTATYPTWTSVPTGIAGLDTILRGGLPEGMIYLLHGGPGSGKTTLGFQFLLEGVRRKERVLLSSLLQHRSELERIVGSHGWSLDGIDLLDIPERIRQTCLEEQTIFSPGEVELQEVAEAIERGLRQYRPQRLLFDSITELAVLMDSPLQLRRQMLRIKELLGGSGCTSIFTANDTLGVDLPSLQTAVHGVIQLGMQQPRHGPLQHWLAVSKMRGLAFLDGRHDFRMRTGGIEVYPRLETPGKERKPEWSVVSSGNLELDEMFGGGLEAGTACLITGTTGAGKSTLASMYVQAAAQRGERSVLFCFDERRETFLRRSSGLGLDMVKYIEEGLVDLRQVNFGALTLGEFHHSIRQAVEDQKVKVLVIDSVTGFFHAIPDHQLIVQLHELLSYLGSAGVLTLLVVPVHGLDPVHGGDLEWSTSYIADTVVMMRHFEATGEMRRCVSVLKKRHGNHERSIREIRTGPGGIKVGPPLTEFRNVLSGRPEYTGHADRLIE
jgi:circadian clock protein KaiC